MNRIIGISELIILLAFICASCTNTGNADETMNTQFAVTLNDSTHLLSSKTYSYLKNVTPPLGVVPVIVTTDSIEDGEIGNYADDCFDAYCDKPYSGATFKQRGVLLVVSEKPMLIQVRVGKTYEIYCRMRGSAAGAGYLNMQRSIQERGLDEMCTIALQHTLEDIESCRHLSWYNKIFFKTILAHVEVFMDDLGTPSSNFFSQFYFKPFLFVISLIRGIVGSWVFAFFIIALVYTLCKNWAENKILNWLLSRYQRLDDGANTLRVMSVIHKGKDLIMFLLKLFVAVPTFASIAVLSTSRTEDLLALNYAHIPYVDAMESTLHWSNDMPALWMILLLMTVYYLKFLFCDTGMFTLACLPPGFQQKIRLSSPKAHLLFDDVVSHGYNRYILQRQIERVFSSFFENVVTRNNEVLESQTSTVEIKDQIQDEPKNWIDLLFIGKDDEQYKETPMRSIMINTHREALGLTFMVGVVASMLLSSTYTIYFLVLWTTQLGIRGFHECQCAVKRDLLSHMNVSDMLRRLWMSWVVFLVIVVGVTWVMLPSITEKSYETIDVSKSIPQDISGLYLVLEAEGEKVQGTTARLQKASDGSYGMLVYSESPVMRYDLEYDSIHAVFSNEFLGTGYVEYNEISKRITIKFSNKWTLIN